MAGGEILEVDGRRISITNLSKVLYPATGTRKYDVIDYYSRIADVMLPHLQDRIVTRKRWPNGVESTPFFEKDLPDSAPEWVRRYGIQHSERVIEYALAEDRAALVWLARWPRSRSTSHNGDSRSDPTASGWRTVSSSTSTPPVRVSPPARDRGRGDGDPELAGRHHHLPGDQRRQGNSHLRPAAQTGELGSRQEGRAGGRERVRPAEQRFHHRQHVEEDP